MTAAITSQPSLESAPSSVVYSPEIGDYVNAIRSERENLSKSPWKSYVPEFVAVAIDSNSAVRNAFAAASWFFHGAAVVAKRATEGLGFVASFKIMVSGSRIAKTGLSALGIAYREKDLKGAFDALCTTAFGAAYSLVGVGMLLAYFVFHVAVVVTLGVIGGLLINVCVLTMYGFIAAQAIKKAVDANRFRNEWKEVRNNPQKAYEFLARQLTLSEDERALDKTERKNRMGEKFRAFTRCVGEETALRMAELMEKTEPVTREEMESVVSLADKESFKQLAKQLLLIGISIIGLAAGVGSFFHPAGGAVAILYMTAAILWVTIDSSKVNEKFGEKVYTWFATPPVFPIPERTPRANIHTLVPTPSLDPPSLEEAAE